MNRTVIIFMFAIPLSACSISKHIHRAQVKVAQFHTLLNAGKVDQIAADADPEFQWPRRGPRFKDYLLSVHRKLGFCGSWRMLDYHENLGAAGTVQINTDTHCDADNARENFVFTSGDLKLKSYTVTSRVLVTS